MTARATTLGNGFETSCQLSLQDPEREAELLRRRRRLLWNTAGYRHQRFVRWAIL